MKGVIVFVKNPQLGKVKTRLAATLGDEKALEIYNKLVDYTRTVLLGIEGVKKYVYYSDFIDSEDEWSNGIFEKKLQVHGGLGSKITYALKNTFNTCDQVIIIGSDCPQLTSDHIKEAFEQLDAVDLVIGPSHDGGYYLLGINKLHPELFEGINWSTEHVFNETIKKAQSLNLSTSTLETLSDVDFEEDWVKFGF